MEMGIEQKDILFAQILHEHFFSQDMNPFVVPIKHFTEKGLQLSDVKNALLRFKRRGFIGVPVYGFGAWEKNERTGKNEFIINDEQQAVTDDDVEVYQIQINTDKFPVPTPSQSISTINDSSIVFDKKAHRLSYSGNYYSFQKAKGRGEMFILLWDSRRTEDANGKIKREGSFKNIWELAVEGQFVKNETEFNEKKATAYRSVRDVIQDFRDAIKKIGVPMEILAKNGYLLVIKG